jgi:hypothetical protein
VLLACDRETAILLIVQTGAYRSDTRMALT